MAAAGRTRDELLARRCQLGEPLAFQELVETMERRLLSYIRRFLDDDEEAADADPLDAAAEEVVEPDWDRLDARRVHEALNGVSATHREVLVLYFER